MRMRISIAIPFLTLFLLADPLSSSWLFSQSGEEGEEDEVLPFTTFKTTRLNNSHSAETLLKGDMDFRVVHRFGDIASGSGGFQTLYGIDEARDIRIAVEYGMTEDFMLGFGRMKGAGPVRGIYEGFLKYRLLRQSDAFPFTVTLLTSAGGSVMDKSEDPTSPAHFEKWQHRFMYFHQAMLATRISDRLSLQLMPSYSHRNLVAHDDKNSVYGMGIGGTLNLNKQWGIVGEYHFIYPRDRKILGATTYDPMSIGVEIETGGHVFHVNISNSGGIGGNQYLPYTISNPLDGEFRFGFTISRLFQL